MTVYSFTSEVMELPLNRGCCGHTIVLSKEHSEAAHAYKSAIYCTVCGKGPFALNGKTTLEELRTQLASAKDREDTLRRQHRETEERLRKEERSKARLKKRIAAGVCPCCKRTVPQMARHIKTKHPGYASSPEPT